MTVELKPEIEALIQKRIESGAFSSAEEVIERALECFRFCHEIDFPTAPYGRGSEAVTEPRP